MLDDCWTNYVSLLDERPQIELRISYTFAGRIESLCWTKEVVPTRYSKVGRISGCVKKMCIPQTPKEDFSLLVKRDIQESIGSDVEIFL